MTAILILSLLGSESGAERACYLRGSVVGLKRDQDVLVFASPLLSGKDERELIPLRADSLFVGEVTNDGHLEIEIPAEFCGLQPWQVVVASSVASSTDHLVERPPSGPGPKLELKLGPSPSLKVTLRDDARKPVTGCRVSQLPRWVRAAKDTKLELGREYMALRESTPGVRPAAGHSRPGAGEDRVRRARVLPRTGGAFGAEEPPRCHTTGAGTRRQNE